MAGEVAGGGVVPAGVGGGVCGGGVGPATLVTKTVAVTGVSGGLAVGVVGARAVQ